MSDEEQIKTAIANLRDEIKENIDELEVLVDKLLKKRRISETVVLKERNWTVRRVLMSDGKEFITFDGPRGSSMWLSPDLAEHSLKWYEDFVPKYVRVKVKDLVDSWKKRYLP